MKRRRIGTILWGMFWLLLGGALLGKVLGWWRFDFFFPGWWTLIFIIPSLIGMISHGFGWFSTICFLFGTIMLVSYQAPSYLPRGLAIKLFLPAVLVVIGLNIIFRTLISSAKEIKKKDSDYIKPQLAAVFSSKNDYIQGPFYGCTIDATFGGQRLDLRRTIMTQDVVIHVTGIFGGATILLPENVKAKVSSVGIFGGVKNKHRHTDESVINVYVNSFCIFGEVTVE